MMWSFSRAARLGIACVIGLPAVSGGLALTAPSATAAPAAPDPPITTACAGTLAGTTFTLSADCDTTATLTVLDGLTVDGAGHTITAHDPGGGNFTGPVLTNAAGATAMSITSLTIRGTGFAVDCAVGSLYGILFNDASGSISGVTVTGITQHSGCPLGIAIRANANAGTARTVTVNAVSVSGFQKAGIIGSGQMTLDVSGSTIGPPDPHPAGLIATNSVQYGTGGAGGTFTNNTVIGSGYGGTTNVSTGMLVFTASNLTITHNTFTGAGTDKGISVNGSTNIAISFNAINRTAPDTPDTSGIGVDVDAASAASTTLVCNSFSGWITDVQGVTQPTCPTPTATPTPTPSPSTSSPTAVVPGFTSTPTPATSGSASQPAAAESGASSTSGAAAFVPGVGLTGDSQQHHPPSWLPATVAISMFVLALGGAALYLRRSRGIRS
jgi:hypothetical protein